MYNMLSIIKWNARWTCITGYYMKNVTENYPWTVLIKFLKTVVITATELTVSISSVVWWETRPKVITKSYTNIK